MRLLRLSAAGFVPAFATVVVLLAASAAGARVNLNELTIQGAEHVELYNSGPGMVLLTNWRIVGSDTPLAAGGTYVFPPGTTIGAGAYLTVNIPPPGIFPDTGAEGALIDAVGSTVDAVWYGVLGSAPLPATTALATTPTLARAPDAADGPPPAPNRYTDGHVWTIAFSPTPGSHNAAPVPAMGSSLRLNELDPKPSGGLDRIELYNPSSMPVNPSSFFVTNGAGTNPFTGSTIPPMGFAVFTTEAGFDLETFGLLYLFAPDGTRVDQLGFWTGGERGAPPLASCEDYGRYPNGSGPFLGFDFQTSGGGATFFPLTASLGFPNPFTSCGHSAVGVPLEDRGSWGRLRGLFR